MMYKQTEHAVSARLFENSQNGQNSHHGEDEQTQLHGVWTSQLVRIKEMVDSEYSRNHPLETTFGQTFARSH